MTMGGQINILPHYYRSKPLLYRMFSDRALVQRKKHQITLVGLGTNVSLSGVKFVLGFQTGSSALVADAVHSASDAISDIIALAFIHISGRLPDAKQPFGYGHFETLGSLTLGLTLAGAGLASGYMAVDTLLHMEELAKSNATNPNVWSTSPDLTKYVAASLILSILSKEALFHWTYKMGKEYKSSILIANAYHHRTDSVSSFVAGLGIVGAIYGYPLLDPIAALIVSGMIIAAGTDVAWQAVGDLTDRQTTDHFKVFEKVKQITERLAKRSDIVSTHDVRLRRMGANRLIDLHVVVDNKLSVTASYQAGQMLRKAILEEMPDDVTDVFVHLDAGEHAFLGEDAEEGTVGNSKKNHYEIEREVSRLVSEQSHLFKVSHVNVHYVVRKANRPLKMIVEVNLLLLKKHEHLTFAALEDEGTALKQALLKRIDGLDAVDLHIELANGEDPPLLLPKLPQRMKM